MRCLNSQQVTPELTHPHITADMIHTAPAEAEENDGMCELVAPTVGIIWKTKFIYSFKTITVFVTKYCFFKGVFRNVLVILLL